jgi:hypothetical protein
MIVTVIPKPFVFCDRRLPAGGSALRQVQAFSD